MLACTCETPTSVYLRIISDWIIEYSNKTDRIYENSVRFMSTLTYGFFSIGGGVYWQLNFERVIKFRDSIVIGLCILTIFLESFVIGSWTFKFYIKSFVIQKV